MAAKLVADAYLVLGKGRYGELKILRSTQTEPSLKAGERLLRLRVEVDPAIWTPAPTPGTTIQVHAPIFPVPEVLTTEWPQSSLTDRPRIPTDAEEDFDPDMAR